MTGDVVLLAHGGGGSLSRALVEGVFLPAFGDPALHELGDAAVVPPTEGGLALTTDAYVVHPRFFPGGDIGTLAVTGTVNDLVAAGAVPRYLTCSFVLEEGLRISELKAVAHSMRAAALEADIRLVAGDTKVVPRGKADGLFITTSGAGELRDLPSSWGNPQPGDHVLVSGPVGDHGFAVLAAREGLHFAGAMRSDCAPLAGLIDDLFAAGVEVRFLRDPTRGGLAAVLNELTRGRAWGITLDEPGIPVSPEARALAEILGIDALQSACEGRMVIVCAHGSVETALRALRAHPHGAGAAEIGLIDTSFPGRVVARTAIGGTRVVPMPLGEQLPRIC